MVLDFTQRLNEAQEWGNTHRDEWAKSYSDTTGLPIDVATAIVTREVFTAVPIDDTVYQWQQDQADAYHDLGLIPELDVKAEFDDESNADHVEDTQ